MADEYIDLSEASPKDKPWDVHRAQAEVIESLYSQTSLTRYAERMSRCSGFLGYKFGTNVETGEVDLHLQFGRFCRVPNCPVCQWRRSKMWFARFAKCLPVVIEQTDCRFVFLTLTVRNCEVTELRSTIGKMNSAWQRLTQLRRWPAMGWLKSVEVTRAYDCYDGAQFVGRHGLTWVEKWEKDHKGRKLRLEKTTEVHPHFHCLLMVTDRYFDGRNYIKHDEWLELWQKCLRFDYEPSIKVNAVRKAKNAEELHGTVMEVLKSATYSIKPDELVDDAALLEELTKQMLNVRRIALGGDLRKFLSESEPEDLIHGDDGPDESVIVEEQTMWFKWYTDKKRYRAKKDAN